MQPRILFPVLAALALSAGAVLAQDAPAPAANPANARPMAQHFDRARMQQHLAQMCTNHYARAVGHMAALEVQLQLTPAQKPLFDRWKNTVLASAKDRSTRCGDMELPDHRPTLVEAEKLHLKMMQGRLDDLRTQMPALEALSASLNDAQQRVLTHAAHQMQHERFAMGGGFGHGGRGMMDRPRRMMDGTGPHSGMMGRGMMDDDPLPPQSVE
ncbi:MAG: Spy/CpxP family protein refolding chaperone [Alphaproteobacteria bacterium]|nr:Spy/CpxP family protein refolding chaperone [Alphaproteobacteria bacterium]